jgi:tellurite resistance protein
MTKPTIRIHNIETNEIVDREMTEAEFDAYEAQQAIESTKQAETEAKAIARAAILDRLGLTEQEAALLLS